MRDIEVTSGLQKGDKVITVGQGQIQNGDKIQTSDQQRLVFGVRVVGWIRGRAMIAPSRKLKVGLRRLPGESAKRLCRQPIESAAADFQSSSREDFSLRLP